MDFNKIVSLHKNDNNQCMVISIRAGEFEKMQDYTEFHKFLDEITERCFRKSKELYNKKQAVIFCDLKGTMIKNMDSKLFKLIIPYFEEKHPDCVEKIVITNIPGFFKICFNLIKFLIHKDTRKKIFFEKKKKKGDDTHISYCNNLEELELD